MEKLKTIKSALVPRTKTFFQLIAQGKPLKATNLLATYLAMVVRPTKVFSRPITIVIDPGNVCNLSCALCITGQKKSLRPAKLLSLSKFKKILKQFSRWAIQLDLYNWGEPLLNKDIFKMISLAKKKGLFVVTSSNLLLLTSVTAKKIINSGLDRLIVSLHGASPQTTQIYMKGGDFNKAIANIKLLTDLKKKMKSKTPEIIWRYVVSSHNELEIEKAKKLAHDLGVCLELLPLKLDIGLDPQQIKDNFRQHAGWLPKAKPFRLYNLKNGKPINRNLDCFWPWEIVNINPDGGIQPCCAYSNPQFDFGNIFMVPFAKIWNGKQYQLARKAIKEKIKTDKSTICGQCVASNFIAK